MAASSVVARRPVLYPAKNSQPRRSPPSRCFTLARRISGFRGIRTFIPAAVSSSNLANSTSLFAVDESFLDCSMLGRRKKVAVLVSGGVDSSVALRLLHAAGHACTAFYLKIWFQVFSVSFNSCPPS